MTDEWVAGTADIIYNVSLIQCTTVGLPTITSPGQHIERQDNQSWSNPLPSEDDHLVQPHSYDLSDCEVRHRVRQGLVKGLNPIVEDQAVVNTI